MTLIYTRHALERAAERGIKSLPANLSSGKRSYSIDTNKVVYVFPGDLTLVVIMNELVVKTCWIADKKAA